MPDCMVTVILPAYNEEQAIVKVIRDIRAGMDGTRYPYEILVVDDCSGDKTSEGAKSEGVRVIRRVIQGGSGASTKTGIKNAKGEIIVMLDADGSYEAADIPKLLDYFPDYDQVNGARISEQGTLKILRVPAKWLIRKLACYLTQSPIEDLNTGLKAFKRDIMMKYLWVIPDGFSCVTTMTLAFIANGYAVKYVPTTYHKRIGKSKFRPVKDTLAYVQTILRMMMYFRPLRIFMPLSVILLLFGLIKMFFSLSRTGSLQESDIILFTGVFFLAILGLMADLIVTYNNRE